MLKHVISTGLTCLLIMLLGGAATAQTPPTPKPLTALFKQANVPADVHYLDGPEQLRVGDAGIFMAVANIETASLPLRSQWDFGDGATASGLHTRHRYTTPGMYRITFTLSNEYGEDADTLYVTVVPGEKEWGSEQKAQALSRLTIEDLNDD